MTLRLSRSNTTPRRLLASLLFVATLVLSPCHIVVAQELATSDATVCLRKADQTVSCWGYNSDGQGSPPPGQFTQISMGAWTGCGVRPDKSAVCWGQAASGLLDVPDYEFDQVDAGDYFNCGIRSEDAKIVCWGTHVGGEYIPFNEPDDHFTDLSVGYSTFCAIRDSGELACSGLGYPYPPPEGMFRDVFVGGDTQCAIRTGGAVVCWGSDNHGIVVETPTTGDFVSVGTGSYHACGLRADQTLTCWGYEGSQDYRQYFPPAGTFSQLAVGSHSNCALRTDGAVLCWGIDSWGQAPQVMVGPKQIDAATAGAAYSTLLAMIDTPGRWTLTPYLPIEPRFTIAAGTLPPGITLAESGALEGTATVEGEWPVTVHVVDAHGFMADRDLVFTVVPLGADTTPPKITASLAGTNQASDWYKTDVQLTWSVEDPESGATSQVGCDPLTVSTDTPITGLATTCVARSVGGVSDETVELRRDATVPLIQITSVRPLTEEEGYPEGYFRAEFTASDATSRLHYTQCGVDGSWGSFCDGRFHEVIGPLEPGEHTFQVRAWDWAGNVSEPQYAALSVGAADTTPPVITPLFNGVPLQNDWYTADVALTWSVVDNESTVTGSSGCDATSVTADTNGTTYTCEATSRGGTTQRAVTIKRDSTPPETTITSGPADPSEAGLAAVLRFTGSDSGSGLRLFVCSLDGAPFTVCPSPMRYTRLAVGRHTFTVRAADNAGNLDQTPPVHIWVVQSTTDLVPPLATPRLARAANQYGWYKANVDIIWDWADTGTGINTAKCIRRTIADRDGVQTYSATCEDLAGNVGYGFFQVRVDKTPPTLAPTVTPSTVILNGAATATPGATDAHSGIAAQSCAAVNTTSVNRTSTTCEATDRAGNRVAGVRAEYVVRYRVTWVSPIAALPAVNIVPNTQWAVPWRYRLSDANGVPVTNVRPAQMSLKFQFQWPCDGPANMVPAPSSFAGPRNLGGGLYEHPWVLNAGCYLVSPTPPMEERWVMYRSP